MDSALGLLASLVEASRLSTALLEPALANVRVGAPDHHSGVGTGERLAIVAVVGDVRRSAGRISGEPSGARPSRPPIW